MRRLLLLFALLHGISVSAQQQKIGDFIESTSYNLDKIGVERQQQYRPRHGSFVCENGTNRYTRALYGSYTDWRLETSDRPVFAVVKKNHHRNIRFVFEKDGVAYPLDETTYCLATYGNGRRYYLLEDQRWGKGYIRMEVLAMPDREAAVWRITSPELQGQMRVIVCQIAQPKLHRNGDIGADKPGCLEAAGEPLQTVEASFGHAHALYLEVALDEVRQLDPDLGRAYYQQARRHYRQLASRIQFDTPDPYINTLGGALALAADGDWDGQTWLHGCIGWRMPLAGWRAGYLGDVLGWNDRAVSHFDAYAKSQVTNVEPVIPHPSQDPKMNLARAEKKWGTQMYSNGYICRNPERNDQMHHYDMNLNYIDELLWHFQYDADTAYMRKMWPVIQSHLAWEKRNYDSDGDHLYDAYCCIWASDALYYNGGAVTHSSAYNYRGNKLAARIAEIIGEDSEPYRKEAGAILKAMNERLWLPQKGVWAEYQDAMGLKRLHDHPAVWSVYTPIDCGACTPEQAYQATRYVDECIPHIPTPGGGCTISTSDWLPYSWSINNVAAAEVMHTALAYYEAGRADEAYRLMKGNILDQMYYGASPGNFGQVSFYDAARGECYRDFGDCIGISSRTLLQGLFGIIPQALDGKCIIRPGFPEEWDSASVRTPYLEYKYTRKDGVCRYEITQNFRQPLKIVLRQNLGNGEYRDIEGTVEEHQVIVSRSFSRNEECGVRSEITLEDENDSRSILTPHSTLHTPQKKFHLQNIDRFFNAEVDDIFKNEYLSPRPKTTTLQIPTQGIGEWCHPQLTAEINDSVFRTLIKDGQFVVAGVPFRTPAEGWNIVYTSLWDNYPDAVVIPLKRQAESVWLLMAGSTNHMQSRIDNGLVIATYKDGSQDTLALRNPDNWCPIEQDYYVDGKAFQAPQPRPYRVCLGTGDVSRDLGKTLGIQGVYGREIPGGAAQMLRMPLNPKKKLKSLTVRTLSNDVVIGLMALTLQ
jgi:hypothetical protein